MSKNDIIIIIFSMVILTILGYGVYDFLKQPLLSEKTETAIYIDDGDIIDGYTMINPPEKYNKLLEIDAEVRKELGEYMIENGYCLKTGRQGFFSFLSFDEMIELEIFEFVPLE